MGFRTCSLVQARYMNKFRTFSVRAMTKVPRKAGETKNGYLCQVWVKVYMFEEEGLWSRKRFA